MSDDGFPSVDDLFPLPDGHEVKPEKPTTFKPVYATLYERIVANTELAVPDNPQSCWLWTGKKRRRGYGAFNKRVDGKHKTFSTHREILIELGIEIPEGHEPDHLCYEPACCNPGHLLPVTRDVNYANRRTK